MERLYWDSHLTDQLEIVGNALVEAMPEAMHRLGSLFGFDPRRIPKAAYGKVAGRVRRYFEAIEPMLQRAQYHEAAGLEFTPTYDEFERMVGAGLRAAGKRLAKGVSPVEWLAKAIRKQTNPYSAVVRRHPDYKLAHNAVAGFAGHAFDALGPDFDAMLNEWSGTSELRKLMAMARGWDSGTLDFPEPKPRRFTERLVERVARTYATLSAFWETRLRFFLWIARAIEGDRVPPERMMGMKLAQILEKVERNPHLNPLASYVNRHVRNALAHGRPDWDRVKRVCVFHDIKCTVEWTCGEFWDQTTRLLYATPALAVLEPMVQARMLDLIMNVVRDADLSLESPPALA